MGSSILSRDRIKYTDYLGSSQQGENCFLNQPVLYKPWLKQVTKIDDLTTSLQMTPLSFQIELTQDKTKLLNMIQK
mgnify:CR=1 FL=1